MLKADEEIKMNLLAENLLIQQVIDCVHYWQVLQGIEKSLRQSWSLKHTGQQGGKQNTHKT